MGDDRKADLIKYIQQYIAGKHKAGTARKILDTIWDVAYLEGYDKAKMEICDKWGHEFKDGYCVICHIMEYKPIVLED